MKNKLLSIFSTKTSSSQLDIALIILRLGVAFTLFRVHGLKKLLHFQETVTNIPDPFGLGGEVSAVVAILANVVFAVFLAFGLATRLSAAFILGVTLTGLFLVHFSDPWSVKDIPMMYSLVMIALIILGGGRYAVDHFIIKNINQPS
ncbi:MAG: DoxX family protein [Bacteroidota bacterium]